QTGVCSGVVGPPSNGFEAERQPLKKGRGETKVRYPFGRRSRLEEIKNKDRGKERRLISCWSTWREEDLSCQIGRFRAECHTIISRPVSTLGTNVRKGGR